MKVYHTSTIEIINPDIIHSREGLDFGKGFYCTVLREQAEAYGLRFSLRGIPAILNEYVLDSAYIESNVRQFVSYDEEWLDFIMANRQNQPVTDYEIIEGGVADDKIFRTIDLYLSGDISKTDALNRLKYEKPNHQICFRSQSVIDRYLKFVSSTKL
ncbi:DUF3990 domain-containing protein [Duncaniella muris]|jgi:hypothetical protein|uniref:DUF3990 domain-containing protein n=1 Tax=Duncaniella muris TaxID=2094150 RepID=UPI000F4AEC90|nr:DUF3990 domain-containing protein [Duncaniella muris]NBH92789.1 DUF3990 domain-containing protein [Muribaculaceae bacterium S4]NBI20546.1 DUF3990 domain-containing protein [Muribaculaceae bacterium Z1]ROS90881.1 DUF3990 domain-containing protein [Muribaculaceae bacterium Isolate-039 (Harlan)]ROS96845.1 DUF3990 domain-containing protein [Muribaculaceae bacterium Isolate-083 (Janvier)]ROS98090.1 DUF3990 domain-containing protein [Muribaculaceae bacterium Isolate-077 (Janvier)]ROT01321.1 DUF3